ncbi:hypothetical protein [Flavisolibacter ginsenosidimutans]|uniref:T9SS type A sorting domain-containing protein n=1 Tax=Flavisolibacter ginsenosidimutans TaxID=661481 RepID=A0A5B8UNP1_9BACT|nr:hypothetical protein [Flavisolibacter ginsenosidimutans]QEC58218.1 hypothetical protein FSB75_20685 [Flavisolibacter ginsenosidimutans]
MRRFFSLSVFVLLSVLAFSQDTLPKFNVRNMGMDADGNARIIIGWVNPYDSLKQISVQRSHDSLKNYTTLVTLADANAKFNGFADNKALNDHMFYRLFIVKKDGSYFFTAPKKPGFDTAKVALPAGPTGNANNPIGTNPRETPEIKKPEVVIKKPTFVPSFYVYTNKDGYVYVNLPDADRQKYHIKFFEEDGSPLFEIKTINRTGLTLDKTDFMHAGWFLFELYNDDKLVEKSKFYLTKEF